MPFIVSLSGIQVVYTRGPQGTQGQQGIQGPIGPSAKIINGTGVPINSLGNGGDYYIDTATGNFYGPKIDISNDPQAQIQQLQQIVGPPFNSSSNGLWGSPVLNLIGPAGTPGAAGAVGATGATGSTPVLIAGTVTALSTGNPPTVSVTLVSAGPPPIYQVNMGIPAGAIGPAGPAGAVSAVNGNIVDNTNPAIPIINQVQPDMSAGAGLGQILGMPAVRITGAFTGLRAFTFTNGILTAITVPAVPPIYANNAAAIGGGLVAGEYYRTNVDPDFICVVH